MFLQSWRLTLHNGPSGGKASHNVLSELLFSFTIYIKSINKNVLPQTKEVLTNQNKFNEYILTSLRTKKGCDTNVLKNNFSSIDLAKIEEEIDRQIQEKTIQIKNTKLTLTKKGMLYKIIKNWNYMFKIILQDKKQKHRKSCFAKT